MAAVQPGPRSASRYGWVCTRQKRSNKTAATPGATGPAPEHAQPGRSDRRLTPASHPHSAPCPAEGVRRTHRARTRNPAAGRDRPIQRRDRPEALHQRNDREDARHAHPPKARPPRPGSSGCARLPDRTVRSSTRQITRQEALPSRAADPDPADRRARSRLAGARWGRVVFTALSRFTPGNSGPKRTVVYCLALSVISGAG
jgi:hypothetical protein